MFSLRFPGMGDSGFAPDIIYARGFGFELEVVFYGLLKMVWGMVSFRMSESSVRGLRWICGF